MATLAATRTAHGLAWPAWAPIVILPATVAVTYHRAAPWVAMMAMAVALFVALKWFTWWKFAVTPTNPGIRSPSTRKSAGYLFAWPGMDAAAFFDDTRHVARPTPRAWFAAVGTTCLGAAVVWWVVPRLAEQHPLWAGRTGLAGIILAFHFGILQLLALAWRSGGVDAQPIMQAPWAAQSVAEFWGRHWNRAFRDGVHPFVFRPLATRYGYAVATVAAFLVSGVVHELVISWPVGGGYGIPTLYFLLQAAAVLAEHTRLGRWLGLGRGLRGRGFAVVIVAIPALILFHPPFILRVILPLLVELGALDVAA